MKEVFRNLMENAVKFIPHTTTAGALCSYERPHRRASLQRQRPGIPHEEWEKIFHKFYQIEGSFTGQVQGMGLGLALWKRVVMSMAGVSALNRSSVKAAPSSSAFLCRNRNLP